MRARLLERESFVHGRRIPKTAVRARMAETGETYQQAQTAQSRVVPRHFVMPPADAQPCIGRCQSEFSLAGEARSDGESMVACGRCPDQSVSNACAVRWRSRSRGVNVARKRLVAGKRPNGFGSGARVAGASRELGLAPTIPIRRTISVTPATRRSAGAVAVEDMYGWCGS
jgi:hypothetical protein